MVGAVALVLSGSSIAHAHGDAGLMAIDATSVSTSAGAPGELTVQVRITFANDGDPAAGAVATASATEAAGAVAAPVTLADAGGGTYSGSMLLPTHGSWTVRVDSTNPVASAEQTVEVAPPPSTTSTTDSEPTSSTEESASSTSSKSSDNTTTVVVVAIAAVLVAAALTTWLVLRSGRSS